MQKKYGVNFFTKRFFKEHIIKYAPEGWDTKLKNVSDWDNKNILEYKKKEFAFNCCKEVPFYTQALSIMPKKPALSILDFGGGFGHYYQLTKAVLPDTKIDFHCKEMPLMADIGKKINPDVYWHTDESYLERTYDLVMINGSLQYIKEWQKVLKNLANAAESFLLLSRLPVVKHSRGYVSIQRYCSVKLLSYQFNQTDILNIFKEIGFKIIKEAVVEDSKYIKNAPEQFEMKGWVLERMIN